MTKTKKILVPNDFTVKPLILLKKIMEENTEDQFEITLLHGIYPSNSIVDLLFYNKRSIMDELESEEYLKACDLFKSKFYSRISSMTADIVTSSRKHMLEDFLEANGIEEVYLPEGIEMEFNNKNSFNVVSLLKKTSLPIHTIAFEPGSEAGAESYGELSGLFLSGLNKSFVKTYEGRPAVS
jgi:hypothetical protein